ncbi:hypothetical protein IFM89_022497 [Coptis chinensis]|uniref:MORF/ORRM1/DAG-like MORF domain-containing protein n=1 Tax=Coptis chinensis TaxID=261450 RepID=A0A835M194_9MAGN|nr:hypothetical protein IFM89_022497 [Coptis chinensis]
MAAAIYRTIFPNLTCFVPICLLSSSSGNLACHSQLKTSDWTPPKFGSTSIDCEEAAKEKIYLISCNLGCPGFSAEVDKETKDQILVTVEGVKKTIPDYYFDARKKDTRTHVLQFD